MKFFLCRVILYCAVVGICFAQSQAEHILELKEGLSALRMYCETIYAEVTDESAAVPDNPVFLPNKKKSLLTFSKGNLGNLAKTMTTRLNQNIFETAAFTFEGELFVGDDQTTDSAFSSNFALHLKPYNADQNDISTAVVSNPIGELGGVRLLFTSGLQDENGELLQFSNHFRPSASITIRQKSKNQRVFSVYVDLDFPLDVSKSGTIQMKILYQAEYKTVEVQLENNVKGKIFELEGILFSLVDFAPGVVIISSKAENMDFMDKWNYACQKNGEYVKSYSTRKIWSKNSSPYLSKDMSFGKWLRNNTKIKEVLDEFGITKEILEAQIDDDFPLTLVDIADIFAPSDDTNTESESGKAYIIYHTHVDADKIVFFTEKNNDEQLWMFQTTYNIATKKHESVVSKNLKYERKLFRKKKI